MLIIDKKVEKILKEKGIVKPEFKTKTDFTVYIFKLIDPVEDKVIKTYEFVASYFSNLPINEKAKYKKLEREVIFNENRYIEYQKEYDEKIKEYQKEYDKAKEEVIKELNIVDFDKMEKVMNLVIDYFEPDEETILEFEEELLYILS